MDLLSKLEKQMKVDVKELPEFHEEVQYINTILCRENIKITEQFQIGLYSHIISFIRRMKVDEKLEPIDGDVLNEITEDSKKLAKEIAVPVFLKYKKEEDLTEILLIAIHIQALKLNNERRR